MLPKKVTAVRNLQSLKASSSITFRLLGRAMSVREVPAKALFPIMLKLLPEKITVLREVQPIKALSLISVRLPVRVMPFREAQP
ncbi:hypothetical protein Barb7_03064 [Bacteroidales bacterium Barb7]|nr:hypothetical protein Barb7_03064 [Bacteroidales bacterium Barb7]